MLKGLDKKNCFVEASSYPKITMFGFNLTWYHYSQKKYMQFIYETLSLKINVRIFMFESLAFNTQFKIQFM
jgi:hypothetical protein